MCVWEVVGGEVGQRGEREQRVWMGDGDVGRCFSV